MTSEFLTWIINLLKDDFALVPVMRKAGILRCCICKTE